MLAIVLLFNFKTDKKEEDMELKGKKKVEKQ